MIQMETLMFVFVDYFSDLQASCCCCGTCYVSDATCSNLRYLVDPVFFSRRRRGRDDRRATRAVVMYRYAGWASLQRRAAPSSP